MCLVLTVRGSPPETKRGPQGGERDAGVQHHGGTCKSSGVAQSSVGRWEGAGQGDEAGKVGGLGEPGCRGRCLGFLLVVNSHYWRKGAGKCQGGSRQWRASQTGLPSSGRTEPVNGCLVNDVK